MTWNKDAHHIKIRDIVGKLHEEGTSLENISLQLGIPLGMHSKTRGKGNYLFEKNSIRWYWRCYYCSKASKKNISLHGGWSGYHKKFRVEQPETYHQHHQNCGKITTNKYGGWFGLHKVLKEQDVDRYHNIFVTGGLAMTKKYGGWYGFHKLKEQNPEQYRLRFLKNLKKANESLRRIKEGNPIVYARIIASHVQGFAKWRADNKEAFLAHIQRISPKGGKRTGEKYGGWYSTHRLKEQDPKKYALMQQKAIVAAHAAVLTKYGSFSKWAKSAVLTSLKNQRENTPYIHDAEHFFSKEELKCYKFLKRLNFNLSTSLYHEFVVGGFHIDFFIDKKLFWEHHPHVSYRRDGYLSPRAYYQERRRVLDENGYKDYPLIVTQSLKELPMVKEKLIELGVVPPEEINFDKALGVGG